MIVQFINTAIKKNRLKKELLSNLQEQSAGLRRL
jgi:hypothetical protein